MSGGYYVLKEEIAIIIMKILLCHQPKQSFSWDQMYKGTLSGNWVNWMYTCTVIASQLCPILALPDTSPVGDLVPGPYDG